MLNKCFFNIKILFYFCPSYSKETQQRCEKAINFVFFTLNVQACIKFLYLLLWQTYSSLPPAHYLGTISSSSSCPDLQLCPFQRTTCWLIEVSILGNLRGPFSIVSEAYETIAGLCARPCSLVQGKMALWNARSAYPRWAAQALILNAILVHGQWDWVRRASEGHG